MRHNVPRPLHGRRAAVMSWVVPSIAAEVWGVSLDHVMSQVRAGEVASRDEFGFLWVEVTAQSAPRPARVRRRSRRSRPQTYTRRPISPVVSPSVAADELQALGETTPAESEAPKGAPEASERGDSAPAEEERVAIECAAPEEAPVEPPEPDECESPEDADDGVPMNWRQGRSRAASSRRRPPGT
jgi:hypothetical protein